MKTMTLGEASTAFYQIAKSLESIDQSIGQMSSVDSKNFRKQIDEDVLEEIFTTDADVRQELFFLTALRHFGILDALHNYLKDTIDYRHMQGRRNLAFTILKIVLFGIISACILLMMRPLPPDQMGWVLALIAVWVVATLIPAFQFRYFIHNEDSIFYLNVDKEYDAYLAYLDELEGEREDDLISYIRDMSLRRKEGEDDSVYYRYPTLSIDIATYYSGLLDNPTINRTHRTTYLEDPEYIAVEQFVRDLFWMDDDSFDIQPTLDVKNESGNTSDLENTSVPMKKTETELDPDEDTWI